MSENNNSDLNALRSEIDKIDDNITEFLLKRFDIVQKVAEYKKANNIEVLQKDREAEVLNNMLMPSKNRQKQPRKNCLK